MMVIVKKNMGDSGHPAFRLYREVRGFFWKKWEYLGRFEDEEMAMKKAELLSKFDGSIIAEYIDGVKQ